MRDSKHHRVVSIQAVLVVFTLIGCTNSKPTVSVRGAPGSVDANCPKKAGSKLADDGLSLISDQPLSSGEKPFTITEMIKDGGFVDLGFMGIATKMKTFTVDGNQDGIVDVLNIPYCVKQTNIEPFAEEWIQRCLSRRTQDDLRKDSTVRSEFLEKWAQPEQKWKRCTAQFSMDPDDLSLRNGQYRVRVWTAEHCFQPAYSNRVTLQVFLPMERAAKSLKLNRGVYVPLEMTSPDAFVWRDKVLAVGGGQGSANDSRLSEKVLILRSSDGRSSRMYVDTYEKYCRNFSEKDFPALDGKSASKYECFAMTDIGTFKGSVSLNQPNPPSKWLLGQEGASAIAAARKEALEYILSEGVRNKTYDRDSGLIGAFPEPLRKHVSMNKFMLSIFDGLQHARRMQSYEHELSKASLRDGLSSFQSVFSMPAAEFHKNELAGLLNGLLTSLLPQIGKRELQPLDTRAMEELALNLPSPGFDEFLSQRLNVFIMKLVNSQFVGDNHPLRVVESDSQFTANLKFLSFQIKLWLDIMLMQKNPGAGVPFLKTVAESMQKILQTACAAQSWGGLLFPVIGNIKAENAPLVFDMILPVKLGSNINIVPIGGNTEDYQSSQCKGINLMPQFGQLQLLNGIVRPKETTFGVRVNDALVSPGPQANLIEYVSSRVVFRFVGAEPNQKFRVAGPGDSGTMLSFMGLPSFVLSTRDGAPVNGVVLAEPPELNDSIQSGGDGSGAPTGAVCK